ncbi:hypothetical protein D6745_01425 [Candidatus Woesearchaeota archaeon]|nr:MAG: hypothetical protein D6745_01425 [Candidatus Woesearchaeota archaeon]
MHHLLSEELIVENCIYCNRPLEGPWTSEFVSEIHYKAVQCSCGKRHRIRIDIFGSGHDEWVSETKKKLNSKITVLEDRVKKESGKQ